MKKYELESGKTYIRIAPCGEMGGDYSFSSEPVLIDKILENGDIVCSYPNKPYYFSSEFTLNSFWNDGKWIPYESMKRMQKTSLNDAKGKLVHRIKPVELHFGLDYSYIFRNYILVTATKYHVILQDEDGKTFTLDSRYTNPDDWSVIDWWRELRLSFQLSPLVSKYVIDFIFVSNIIKLIGGRIWNHHLDTN